MITPDQQLRLLNDERASLRPAILAMQVSMHRALFLLVTVGGAVVGLYWKPDAVPEDARPLVLLVLTQVEVFLSLFVIGLVAHQNVVTGYVAALESTINRVSGVNLNLFESRVSPRFYQSLHGVFGWSKVLIFIFLVGLFAFVGKATPHSRPVIIGLVIEAVILACLLLATLKEYRRVYEYALHLLTPPNPRLAADGHAGAQPPM